jgi:hypothetical protein
MLTVTESWPLEVFDGAVPGGFITDLLPPAERSFDPLALIESPNANANPTPAVSNTAIKNTFRDT